MQQLDVRNKETVVRVREVLYFSLRCVFHTPPCWVFWDSYKVFYALWWPQGRCKGIRAGNFPWRKSIGRIVLTIRMIIILQVVFMRKYVMRRRVDARDFSPLRLSPAPSPG